MTAPRLTAAQRRRVRVLMEDEGESRASAVAWVLAMETPLPPEYDDVTPAGRAALDGAK